MKRMWFGLLILILLLAMGIGTGLLLGRCYRSLEEQLTLAAAEPLPHAQALAEEARHSWAPIRNITAVFSPHAPLEQLESGFAELQICAGAGDDQTHRLVCARLAAICRNVAEILGIKWWSLL